MYTRKIESSLITVCICMIAFACDSNRERNTEAHDHEHDQEGPVTEVVTGRLSGFDCAVVGSLCPSTHRGADYTTGVYTDDGAFYFIVNIPQSFLRQYFLETVEVEGTMYSPYDRTLEPEAINLVGDEDRSLVYEAGYFIDEDDQRATFQEGIYRNGRWNVQ